MRRWVAGCVSQLVSCNRPSAMRYSIFCTIIGEKSAFKLLIDDTWIVDELKDEIKKKAAQTLASIDAFKLTLYKVDIDMSMNYRQVIEIISQDKTYTQEIQGLSTKRELDDPSEKLSVIFSPRPADRRISILVELPPGESIDSIDPRVWCVAETSFIRPALSISTLFICLVEPPPVSGIHISISYVGS